MGGEKEAEGMFSFNQQKGRQFWGPRGGPHPRFLWKLPYWDLHSVFGSDASRRPRWGEKIASYTSLLEEEI